MTPRSGLLHGAVDLHVHAGPAYIKRRTDAITMARQAAGAGMATLVLKDHHAPTATLAVQVDREVQGITVRGSVVLNATVGGINPSAVEANLAVGAAVVWLPTISAQAHKDVIGRGTVQFPASGRTTQHDVDGLVPIVDDRGGLRPEVHELLEVLTSHPHTILATGHVSAAETQQVIEAALDVGLNRILVTHPDYIVGASLDQMRSWARRGVYSEIAGSTSWSGSSIACIPIARTLDVIREVGTEALVLSSDFGQRENPPHCEALTAWLEELLAAGVSREQIRTMLVDNPTGLLAGT